MAKGDIPLHPEHGVNPTMPVCFWCGKDTGEIALLGNKYKGEAPSRMVLSYNPCEECQTAMATGIALIEIIPASETENPPWGKDGAESTIAPSGSWMVITPEAVERMFPADAERVVAAGKALMQREVFQHLQARVKATTDEG